MGFNTAIGVKGCSWVGGFGVLLHVTSLPGKYSVGDLGQEAYRFIDLLAEIGASYWQVLPLNPTSLETANSPYSSVSAFAGNHLLINPDMLAEENLLKGAPVISKATNCKRKVCYKEAYREKEYFLNMAYREAVKEGLSKLPGYEDFVYENRYWLDDYALFMSLKKILGKPLGGTWKWRMLLSELESPKFHELGELAELYGRR